MLQRSQIGKTKSKKSQAGAMLNRIFVTPAGEKYSLVEFYKIGNKYHWVYEWINCPEEIRRHMTACAYFEMGILAGLQHLERARLDLKKAREVYSIAGTMDKDFENL